MAWSKGTCDLEVTVFQRKSPLFQVYVHRSCGSGNITFSFCYVTLEVGAPQPESPLCQV